MSIVSRDQTWVLKGSKGPKLNLSSVAPWAHAKMAVELSTSFTRGHSCSARCHSCPPGIMEHKLQPNTSEQAGPWRKSHADDDASWMYNHVIMCILYIYMYMYNVCVYSCVYIYTHELQKDIDNFSLKWNNRLLGSNRLQFRSEGDVRLCSDFQADLFESQPDLVRLRNQAPTRKELKN